MTNYLKQIMVIMGMGRLFKGASKKKLLEICIVGIGGLGTNTTEMLARIGNFKLKIIDDDPVELDNLQRQVLFNEDDISYKKVLVAKKRLKDINPKLKIKAIPERLTENNLHHLDSDLVLDCVDNLHTKFLINSYCNKKEIPWIFCTVVGEKGFVKMITTKTACLSCFYKLPDDPVVSRRSGILNTAARMASVIQMRIAREFIIEDTIDETLYSFNTWKSRIKKINVNKHPICEECSK